jgi:hypothetical protein
VSSHSLCFLLLLLSLSQNFPSLGFSLSIESKDRSSERPRVLDQQIEENLVEAQASKRIVKNTEETSK